MRIRHKVPSIFSLSMVDVLCCALGCVILIWLLNAKQSEDEADERREEIGALRLRAEADKAESATLLTASRAEYTKAGTRLRQLLDERQKAAANAVALEARIRDLEAMRTSLEKGMAVARADADDLEGKMKRSSARVAALEGDLKTAISRADALEGTLGKTSARLKGEETAVRAARANLAAMGKLRNAERVRADALAKSLAQRERDLDTTTKSLTASNLMRTTMETALARKDVEIKNLQAVEDRYAAAMKREIALDEKLKARLTELDAAERKITTLERGSKDYRNSLTLAQAKVLRLENERLALRADAESRFAGINLTGKKVIFLVDTSGSMMMIDSKTDAPQKWQEVYSTVGKLMKSLPALEQFQVITFAKTTKFPLGSSGKWLRNDGTATAQKVEKTLAAIKPSGGTNMYVAFEAAFSYRDSGLDTIYLLSDGLPNHGEGLTAEERTRLNEFDRSQKLGRFVLAKLKTNWNKPLAKASRVRINTIGFFYESPDLGSFLWALARDNDGNFVGMSNP
jgi:von Willebrand factor type A domain